MHVAGKFRARAIAAATALLLLVLSLSNCTPSGPQPTAETATTLLLVRHAEKAAEPGDDPPLTEAGRERAAALARMAASSGVSAVYATQYLRTQQTVEPLAAQLGLTIRQRDSGDTDGLVAQVLSENRGQTVVVAGHSNTVPMLVEKLTGKPVPPIEENEYDNLYVVTSWGTGHGTAVRLRYGSSSGVVEGAMQQK
jgi:broad specificity phosphatase PhoE